MLTHFIVLRKGDQGDYEPSVWATRNWNETLQIGQAIQVLCGSNDPGGEGWMSIRIWDIRDYALNQNHPLGRCRVVYGEPIAMEFPKGGPTPSGRASGYMLETT